LLTVQVCLLKQHSTRLYKDWKSLEHREVALGAFLDFEGAFNNTSFEAIITAAIERGLEETCCRWIKSMLGGRLVHTSLMGSSLTAKVVGGWSQGESFLPSCGTYLLIGF
jgi:hypothetical protein